LAKKVDERQKIMTRAIQFECVCNNAFRPWDEDPGPVPKNVNFSLFRVFVRAIWCISMQSHVGYSRSLVTKAGK